MKIAHQLSQTGKSKDEIIAQLMSLGLEEYSAKAMLDHMLTPQEMTDSENHWRLMIGVALIAGSILTFTTLQITHPNTIFIYLTIAIGIVGISILAYNFTKG